MKKNLLVIIVSVLVLGATVLWFREISPVHMGDYMQFIIIGILVCFGLYAVYRRLISGKRGQPAEDEFSKKIVQKAAAMSYYISLYLWLVIMYLADKQKAETELLFGWGILGMAIIFGVLWTYFNFRGVKDE